ncbi:hypothetical protein [Glycocaulis sp.]|uniref:hypothetical protein n=1 Tax=Glycocaulis sp. TaxID=1969725 RepID=UPI003D1BCC99
MIALLAAALALNPAPEMSEVDLNIYCNAQAGVMMQYDDPDIFAENLMISTGEWLDAAVADGRTTQDHIYDAQDSLFPVNQELILADDMAALEVRFAPCREAFED